MVSDIPFVDGKIANLFYSLVTMVSDIPFVDGKIANLFYSLVTMVSDIHPVWGRENRKPFFTVYRKSDNPPVNRQAPDLAFMP
jgi:hypothetical protein